VIVLLRCDVCAGDLEAALHKQLPGHVHWAATKSEKNFKEYFQVSCLLLLTFVSTTYATASQQVLVLASLLVVCLAGSLCSAMLTTCHVTCMHILKRRYAPVQTEGDAAGERQLVATHSPNSYMTCGAANPHKTSGRAGSTCASSA
jgi:hypothetical protein